jgi:CheY-like chemotaxis protein
MPSVLADPPRVCLRLEAASTPQSRRARASTADVAPDDLPLRPGEAPMPADRPGRLPESLVGIRLLVVDDDEETLELFAAALGACGAEVSTATSATEALRVLETRGADVVVSDIAMPGGDGYWLVREIRRMGDERLSRVPVVAVTAYGREHSPARALAAGFALHLQKPVDPEVLCRTVAALAGR